jgi:photosystem II stability/assembly factor-like uncharacterized protein
MDGGLHWEAASANPTSVGACPTQGEGINYGSLGRGAISFASASTGIMQAQYCVQGGPGGKFDPQRQRQFVTQDGGLTWNVQILPAPFGGLSLPVFFDQLHGVAFSGSLPGLLVTSDGGDTWSPRQIQLGLDAVYFIKPDEGWGLLPDREHGSASLFHTNDGGQTWTLVNGRMPDVDLRVVRSATDRLIFIDSRYGFWATGVCSSTANCSAQSKLYKTADGGHTWVEVHARVQ